MEKRLLCLISHHLRLCRFPEMTTTLRSKEIRILIRNRTSQMRWATILLISLDCIQICTPPMAISILKCSTPSHLTLETFLVFLKGEYYVWPITPWEGVTFWHELMSLDPKRARKFYEGVLGLTAAPIHALASGWRACWRIGPASGRQKKLALGPKAALGEFLCHRRC